MRSAWGAWCLFFGVVFAGEATSQSRRSTGFRSLESHHFPCRSCLAQAATHSATGWQRRGHPRPSELVYSLTHFEMIPFVLDREAREPIRLIVGVEGPEATHLSLDTAQLPFIEDEVVFLEDDGFPPDAIAEDGRYTALLRVDPEALGAGSPDFLSVPLRQVEFEVHNSFGIDRPVIEDVGYSYGVVDGQRDVEIHELGDQIYRSERVANLVHPELLTGHYPTHGLDLEALGQAFSRHFPDRFDWLVAVHLYNARGQPSADHRAVRNGVAGIGLSLFDESASYGSDGVLRSVVELYYKSAEDLTHNLFHTWGVYGWEELGLTPLISSPGHWGALAAAEESTVFQSPPTFQRIEPRDGGGFCAPFGAGPVLSLEHYLMGRLPLEAVDTYAYLREAQFSGIGCGGYFMRGSGVGQLSPERIEEVLGRRDPPYPDVAQYHAAVVAVSDRVLETVEFDYLERVFAAHAREFSQRFEGRARVRYELKAPENLLIREWVLEPDTVAVSVSGPPGTLVLQSSDDLVQWRDWVRPAPTGEVVFRLPRNELGETSFFRAVGPPKP